VLSSGLLICPEIEFGPHFITFYVQNKQVLTESRKAMFEDFCKQFPEYAAYQTNVFMHIPQDPNMYHPFGTANFFRKHYQHFHINLGHAPTMDNFERIKSVLSKYMEFPENLIVSKLEDNRLPKFKDLQYPELTGDYKAYIAMLRTGAWINGDK